MTENRKSILRVGVFVFIGIGCIPPHTKTTNPWPEASMYNTSILNLNKGNYSTVPVESTVYRFLWLDRVKEEKSYASRKSGGGKIRRAITYKIDYTLLIVHWIAVAEFTASAMFFETDNPKNTEPDLAANNELQPA